MANEAQRSASSVGAKDRAGLLLELATAVGAELKLDGLVRATGAVLRRSFPHEFMDLVLHDPEQGTLRVHTLVEPEGLSGGPLEAGYTFPAAGSVHGDVIRERRPFVANTQAELDAATLRPEERALARTAKLRAACVLPLVSRGRAIGTLGFLGTREGTPSWGAPAAATVLQGTHPAIGRLAAIHPDQNPRALARAVFGSFPSTHLLLPWRERWAGSDLDQEATWSAAWPTPRVELLALARREQAELAAARPGIAGRVAQVVGIDRPTVVGLVPALA